MGGMDRSSLVDVARAHETAYLATVAALVEHESPTHDKPLADALADHLQARLESDGWEAVRHARDDVGDVLEARLPGRPTGGDATSTLLLCHYDTVWPRGTLDVMPLRRDGARLYGPGVLDMKAGIATALHAPIVARAASAPLRGNVTLLITSDEEKGSAASRAVIEELAAGHDRVLVLEPGRDDGAVKTGRKGVGQFHIDIRGRSAHAGNNPSEGASALRELAHLLLYIEDLADGEAGTTVNLTVARGGTTGNVIAEHAEADVDLRVLKDSEAARVSEAVRAYRARDERVQVTVEGGLNRPPLEATPANAALWSEALDAGRDLGLQLHGATVGGGSDGSFTSAAGVPTLDGLGSVGAGPHARHEHIHVPATLERLALVTALLTSPAGA